MASDQALPSDQAPPSDPPLVPVELSSGHVLVLPAASGQDQDVAGPVAGSLAGTVAGSGAGVVAELAAAWFDDAAWLTEPRDAPPPAPTLAARLRGLRRPAAAASTAAPEPGTLRLGGEHRLTGPFPVSAVRSRTLGVADPAVAWALDRGDARPAVRGARPASYDDADGLARAFAAGLPVGAELPVVRWAVAAARRVGGALLVDGRHLLRPDPTAVVDLTLWTTRVLTPTDLLAAVRALVATAQPAADDGAQAAGYRVVATTPYDGTTVVDVVRAEHWPRGVVAEQGRAVAYRLRWVPQDPEELLVEDPSGVHVIARARARVLHARLAQELRRRAGGTVLDDDGFVVGPEALEERLSGASGSRAWV